MTNLNIKKFIEPNYGPLSKEVFRESTFDFDLDNIVYWRNNYNYKVQNLLTNYWKDKRVFDELMSVEIKNEQIEENAGYKIPIRIYTPPKEGIFPVLIFYHGGGFMMNNIEIYDLVHRYLAKFGDMIVVAPDYRLAPENKFPIGLEDSYETLKWTSKNMENIRGNSKITVCGDSSGGNFATVVSMMARDRKGPHVDKQVLIYPCVNTVKQDQKTISEEKYGKGFELDFDGTKQNFSLYFKNESDCVNPYASPILGDLENLPSSYFISAECDALLDQGLMYASKLKNSNVDVEYKIYEGMPHAFINRPYQRTFDALDYICTIVNKK